MFSKRTLLGGLVAFLVLFFANWLLWGVVFMGTWENMSSVPMTTEPDMLWLTLGYLALGWLFAYIYPLGYEGGGALAEGTRFGLVMWGVTSVAMGMIMQGFQPDNLTAFFFAQAVNLVVYLLMGIALAKTVQGSLGPEPMAAPAEETPPPPGQDDAGF